MFYQLRLYAKTLTISIVALVLLPLIGQKRLLAILLRKEGLEINGTKDNKEVTNTIEVIQRVTSWLPGGRNCLLRTIIAKIVLAYQHNLKSRIIFGIKIPDKESSKNIKDELHAWLEDGNGDLLIGVREGYIRFTE